MLDVEVAVLARISVQKLEIATTKIPDGGIFRMKQQRNTDTGFPRTMESHPVEPEARSSTKQVDRRLKLACYNCLLSRKLDQQLIMHSWDPGSQMHLSANREKSRLWEYLWYIRTLVRYVCTVLTVNRMHMYTYAYTGMYVCRRDDATCICLCT